MRCAYRLNWTNASVCVVYEAHSRRGLCRLEQKRRVCWSAISSPAAQNAPQIQPSLRSIRSRSLSLTPTHTVQHISRRQKRNKLAMLRAHTAAAGARGATSGGLTPLRPGVTGRGHALVWCQAVKKGFGKKQAAPKVELHFLLCFAASRAGAAGTRQRLLKRRAQLRSRNVG